jgi:hypothetical protein
MNAGSKHITRWLVAVLIVIAAATVVPPVSLNIAFDGHQYLEFSDQILAGSFWSESSIRQMPLGSILRTPLYPALLTIRGLTDDDSVGIRILHGLAALHAFLALAVCSRGRLPLATLALSFAVASWSLRLYFSSVSTEWVAFCSLVVVAALLLVPRAHLKQWQSIALLIMCALMPLLRPALWMVVVLPFIRFPGVYFRTAKWMTGSILLVLFPLGAWISINSVRLGEATLSPVGRFSIFAVASLVGNADKPSNNHAYEEFRESFNESKLTFTREELIAANTIPRQFDIQPKYDHNMFLAWKLGADRGLDPMQIADLQYQYAKQSISENFGRYLLQPSTAVRSLGFMFPLLVPLALLPWWWFRRKQNIELAATAVIVLGLHVVHVIASSLIFFLEPRFYALTLAPCLMVSVLVAGRYLSQIWKQGIE